MRCGLLVAIWMLAMAAGCAATRPATPDPLAAAPEDFGLELIVRRGPDLPEAADVHLRPGHFLFLPDGSLHYAAGPTVAGEIPPEIRTLDRGQVAELWSLTGRLGLADPAANMPPLNFDLIEAPEEGVVYLLGVTGDDRRWAFVDEARPGETPDPAAVRLVHYLADLAWVDEEPAGRITIIPRRYDLGPDPYARYREP
ncbi:MAG: hypothetical protein SYC29_02350 [Planctomycetota bacterium]|nr:hypothetical protein [Planctomycetota bacterium]